MREFECVACVYVCVECVGAYCFLLSVHVCVGTCVQVANLPQAEQDGLVGVLLEVCRRSVAVLSGESRHSTLHVGLHVTGGLV